MVHGAAVLGYRELDRRANRLAWRLHAAGAGPGGVVGVRLPRGLPEYVALLGVLKAGAAYRVLPGGAPTTGLTAVLADEAGPGEPGGPETGPAVAVDPAAPCCHTANRVFTHQDVLAFLRVAAPGFGLAEGDRVYQGTPLTLEHHLYEVWPCFAAGATVVAPGGEDDLDGQLAGQRVTVLCGADAQLRALTGVPATVRCVLVHGAPLPTSLVRRWARPGRRILSCSGPTRAARWGSAHQAREGR